MKLRIRSWFGDRIEVLDKLLLKGQDKPNGHSDVAATGSWNGFDREAMLAGSREMGIMEFCLDASGAGTSTATVYIIGSEKVSFENTNNFKIETDRSTFADGTPLTDFTLCHSKDDSLPYFKYWNKGTPIYIEESKKVVIPTDFKNYVYYDEDTGVLTANTTKGTDDLIKNTILISQLYINTTNTGEDRLIWYADERHGTEQSGEDHLQQHGFPGFRLVTGLQPEGFIVNSKTFDAVDWGVGNDEDIANLFTRIQTGGGTFQPYGSTGPVYEALNGIRKMYVNGGGYTYGRQDMYLCEMNADNSKGQWNDITKTITGDYLIDLGAVANKDFVAMTLMASNNKIAPVVSLVGQEAYKDRKVARDRVNSAWSRLSINLPSHEFMRVFVSLHQASGAVYLGEDKETGYDYRNVTQSRYYPD